MTDADKTEWRCGTDVFAAAFFMLTRWEEHVVAERDAHGRFPASAAAAVRFGFLDRPVVNEWADLLYNLLQKIGWRGQRPERSFQLSLSCDVDHPRLWWSAADRLKTLGGSLLGRKNPNETRYWLENHIFSSADPYDVFDEWLALFRKFKVQTSFNFLGDRQRSSDCYYPVRHPFVKNTMEKLAEHGHSIGFHPSYEAFENRELFGRELESVRDISPVPVTSGRQHYLRFEAPFTWQVWDSAGMDWDSTLGYSEMEGFRCGICHDYPVFDFINRKMLRLREKPLIAMDVTLAQYRQYTPEIALERLLQLKKQVLRHQGEFVFLWHNSSWNTYFWAPWKAVFLQFLSS
jgi:peptidoglycan/xylan/chitin deacetylase (PgdA/CDA1 family)